MPEPKSIPPPKQTKTSVHKIDSAVSAFVRQHTNITPLYLAYLFDLHDKHQPIDHSLCIDWKWCKPHSLGFLYRLPKKFKITWKQQIIWGWLAGKDETVMGLKCNGGTTEKDIKIKEVFPQGSMNMLSESDVILCTVLEGSSGEYECALEIPWQYACRFSYATQKRIHPLWIMIVDSKFQRNLHSSCWDIFLGWTKVLQALQPANHVTSASSGLAVSRVKSHTFFLHNTRTINKSLIWRFVHLLLRRALIS